LSVVARELAFPAIIFPCFIVLAFLLALVLRKDYDWPRRLPAWGLCLAGLLGAIFIYSLKNAAALAEVSIDADMLVTSGNRVELYINDLLLDPQRSPVVEGQRHVYHFGKVAHDITLLRIDPTEQPNARVTIYGITVRSGAQVFRQFAPADLKSWRRSALSDPQDDAGGITMAALTNDPTLSTEPALHLPGGAVEGLSVFVDPAEGPFLLVIVALMATLLARTLTRAGRLQAAQIALAGCVAYPIVVQIMKLDLLTPPVRTVVGFASYNGYAKANETLSSFVVMLVCAALAYGCAKLVGRGEDPVEEAGPESKQRNVWITHAVIFVMLVLYFCPNFLAILQNLKGTVYHNDSWDAANSLLWNSLINKGLRPYRDFWYPYGGFYIQLLRFPAGELWSLVHCTVILWSLYYVTFRLTGRRLKEGLILYGLLMIPLLLGIISGWHRYLMPSVLLMYYASICDVRRLEWKTHLPFAALVGYVCFCEPPQIVCATSALILHAAFTVVERFRGANLRERLSASLQALQQRAICIGIPWLGGIAACAMVYAANGMLTGIWDFEKSVTDQGDYAAVPAEIAKWLLPALQPEAMFLLLFLTASYAVYRWTRVNGKYDPLGIALLTISASGFVAMQKQIIRPHVMTQVRIYPYVTAILLGMILWRERKPAARIVMAMFVGSFFGIAYYQGLFAHVYRVGFRESPSKVAETTKAIFYEGKTSGQVNDTLYAPSRFVGFDNQSAVVNKLTGELGLTPQDSFFVLGDDLIFYILLNQAPPYSSNEYNESPIYEQQKVLDWLQRKNPRLVIWGRGGPEGENFDRVPNIVRLPLVYDYVIENYKFLSDVATYRILTRRPANEPVDMNFWRDQLGSHIDLGRVPRRARLSEYGPCDGDKSACDPVLVVRYPNPAPVSRGKVSVSIQGTAGAFSIEFDAAPGQRDYVINLNRVWFWKPLVKMGTPDILTQDARAQTFLGFHRERGAVLY
jgi:hypothetical protein